MDRNAFKPIKENPIILDFTGCKYWGEIHKILKERFNFPNYYGENLDALWDCLRDYEDEGKVQVYVKGANQIPEELSEHMGGILKVFNRVHKESPNITFEIID